MSPRNFDYYLGGSQSQAGTSTSQQVPGTGQSWMFAEPQPQRHAQGPSTHMTDAGSAFFNPEPDRAQQIQDHNARQYQEWIDAFGSQQTMPQDRQGGQGLRSSVTQASARAQHPYNQQIPYSDPFSQFTSSSTGNIPPSTTDVPETTHSSSFRRNDMDAFSQFYDNLLDSGIAIGAPVNPGQGQALTPESTLQSYNGTPEPAFLNTHTPMPSQLPQQTFQNRGAFTSQDSAQIPLNQPTYQPHAQVPQNRPVRFRPQYPQNAPQQQQSAPKSLTAPTESRRTTNASPQHSQFVQERGAPSVKAKAPTATMPASSNAPSSSRSQPQHPVASTSTARPSTKRKRQRKDYQNTADDEGDSGSETEDDDGNAGGYRVGMAGLGVVSKAGKNERTTRLPGACTHCKKLKMKCDFVRGADTCKRCKSGGHACIVEGRKPRTAPNKREYLLAQIRQKDQIIESLLKQLHNPYLATPLSIASYRIATSPSDQNKGNVLAWLDQLQASVRDSGAQFDRHKMRDTKQDDSDKESESDGRSSEDDDHDLGDHEEEKAASSLPDTHVPLGLIANLSLNNSKKSKKSKKKNKDKDGKNVLGISEEDLNDDNVGIANETYFMPGPATDLNLRATLIEQHSPPEILVHGLVTPDDVQKLFDLFFKNVNPFISLLDPAIHSPATTFSRCPFLYTVVCAIASRYYSEKSEIYPIAMHFAKHSAATALTDGWKSVELCQAYILMSIYAVPARRWEEDRSWLYAGLAIRLATDLNLHQVSTTKATSETQERENLNKTRTWMICYNLDRSTATQFGKPSTIKDHFIVRNVKEWYKQSKLNHPFDLHLCAYSALLQIVSKFHDQIFSDPTSPTGLNKKVDFRAVTLEYDGYLTDYHTEWLKRFDEESDKNNPGCVLRTKLLPFLVAYSRLVMFSFGFQQAYRRGLQPSDHIFFSKCLESAKGVIETVVDSLVETGCMKYAPDGHFVFATFASAFLLKLLRPEFSNLLTKEQETEVLELIGKLLEALASPKVAIDDRHTPKLYARFLISLLSRYRRDGITVGRLQTQPPSHQQLSAPNVAPGGSMSTFSLRGHAHQAGSGASMGGDFSRAPYQQQTRQMGQDIPIYMPEATFAAGVGEVSFGSDFEQYGLPGSEEMTLAPMQALRNPAFWGDVMMPGSVLNVSPSEKTYQSHNSWSGTWPEPSPSPPNNGYTSSQSATSLYSHPGVSTNHDMNGLGGSFSMFHSSVPAL